MQGVTGYEALPVPSDKNLSIERYNLTHSNKNDSSIKTKLDKWYENTLKNNYSTYLSIDAGFCNDRSVANASGRWHANDTALGYGTTTTYYGSYNRALKLEQPQFKCENENNNLFTLSTNNKGNKKLTNPVGLITIDEIIYAGGNVTTTDKNSSNDTYYLNNGLSYWTMSPVTYMSYNTGTSIQRYAMVGINYNDGSIYSQGVIAGNGVRPIINLKSDVEIINGDGTSTNPYVVDTQENAETTIWALSTNLSNEGVAGVFDETQKLSVRPVIEINKKYVYGESQNPSKDDEADEENPSTGDNIIVALLTISAVFGITMFAKKKLNHCNN